MTVGKRVTLLATLTVAVVAAPLIEGCCTTQENPLSAAQAALKILAALQQLDDADPENVNAALENLAQVIAGLSIVELKSAVFFASGQTTSISDAEADAIKALAGQLNATTIGNLSGVILDPSDLAGLQQALGDADINLTEAQIQALASAMQKLGSGGGDITSLLTGLGD